MGIAFSEEVEPPLQASAVGRATSSSNTPNGVSRLEEESPPGLPPARTSYVSVIQAAEDDKYYAGSSLTADQGAIHCKGFAARQELTLAARGLVIAMVGLPGRGKSFIARKLEGFLKWQCLSTSTFNAGRYRRESEGAQASGRADFFDPQNSSGAAAREAAAMGALGDAIEFLNGGGEVSIFDATNSTNERRQLIVSRVKESRKNYRVLFIEVLCDDPEVLSTNFRNKVIHSPDFAGLDLDEAMRDLHNRVAKYEEAYQEIADDSLSYIKLYNMSSKVLGNKIYGSVAKSIMPYLMSIHIGTRPIWLVRAGEVPTGEKKDACLTERGQRFAASVASFVCDRTKEFYGGEPSDKPVRVLSSTMVNAVQTIMATLSASSKRLSLHFKQTSSLNPIDRGRLDGPWWIDHCTDLPPFDELETRDPSFRARWQANPLRTRFPGGESYYDVMTRAESVLLEMEMSTRPVLCVSHITCIQVILSYFQGLPLQEAWKQPVPEHSVIQVIPTLGGSYKVEILKMDDTSNQCSEIIIPGQSAGNNVLQTGWQGQPDTPHNLDLHGDGRCLSPMFPAVKQDIASMPAAQPLPPCKLEY